MNDTNSFRTDLLRLKEILSRIQEITEELAGEGRGNDDSGCST